MFSVIPSKFLPNSKSPCWYEEFTGRNTTDPYLTNSYVLYSKRFRSTFDALRKAFWGHLSHASGKHFRLRCLPRFYIIGQPKCGTTDLYDRLRLHPEVKFSAIKEPHWWTRKRFGERQLPPRGEGPAPARFFLSPPPAFLLKWFPAPIPGPLVPGPAREGGQVPESQGADSSLIQGRPHSNLQWGWNPAPSHQGSIY